jgi:hypothetical protein
MLQTGGGASVNDASGVGLIGFPTVPVYVASTRRQRWTKPKEGRLDCCPECGGPVMELKAPEQFVIDTCTIEPVTAARSLDQAQRQQRGTALKEAQ